jgi:hypothetical protein
MTKGETLYSLYLKIFGTLFAPKWPDLTDESRQHWNDLATMYGQKKKQGRLKTPFHQQYRRHEVGR